MLFATSLFRWIYDAEGVFFWPQTLLAFLTLTHLFLCIDLFWLNPLLSGGRRRRHLDAAIRESDPLAGRDAVRGGGGDLERIVEQGFQAAEQGASKERLEEELGLAVESVELD